MRSVVACFDGEDQKAVDKLADVDSDKSLDDKKVESAFSGELATCSSESVAAKCAKPPLRTSQKARVAAPVAMPRARPSAVPPTVFFLKLTWRRTCPRDFAAASHWPTIVSGCIASFLEVVPGPGRATLNKVLWGCLAVGHGTSTLSGQSTISCQTIASGCSPTHWSFGDQLI